LWPGGDAVGKRFVQEYGGPALLVVGVARDAKYRSLFEERRLTYYQPLAQDYWPEFVVHLRAAGDPRGLVLPLERLVHALDPDLPVYRPQTLGDRRDASLSRQRTAASLVGTFGALALVLAAVGLYAALSYAVTRRTREFGIRLALGARAADVQRQVLRQGVRLALVGLGVGLVGAALVTRVLKSQLYQVSPTDPGSYATVAVVLLATAALACFVPARRATRVDPMTALRVE
jgi:ABC-type antimicrobial peptide transport system permease subunit